MAERETAGVACCDFRAAFDDQSLASRFASGVVEHGKFEIKACDECLPFANALFNSFVTEIGRLINADQPIGIIHNQPKKRRKRRRTRMQRKLRGRKGG